MALTPMMQQYYEIKKQSPDCLLFFRLGDFYEMFEQDALEAVAILGITLTARTKGDDKIPMCGVPYHAAAGYIAKLTRAGRKVAICEQVSDPALPGIVKREIVRIVTPGTTLDENVLEERRSNYLCAVAMVGEGEKVQISNDKLLISKGGGQFGLALAELSTGEFLTLELGDRNLVLAELQKYRPRELLWVADGGADAAEESDDFKFLKAHYPQGFWHVAGWSEGFLVRVREQFDGQEKVLSAGECRAAGAILNYLEETQKTRVGSVGGLQHLREVKSVQGADFLALDEASIRNLELLENAREKKVDGSLLSVIDKTVTSAGGRMLKKVIVQPLARIEEIEKRLCMIDFFLGRQNLLLDLRGLMKGLADLERILGRLNVGTGNARDMRGMVNSYKLAREIRGKLLAELAGAPAMVGMVEGLDLLDGLIGELDAGILDEPAFSIREGGMIRDGFNAELDQYKAISRDGKGYIQALQAREVARSGINSLKVKFNRVFGYYIEISNANLAQVPADYTRKQTLANAERFSTPELKEYEEKVLGAEEKIFEMEGRIFEELRQKILGATGAIKRGAATLAYLDVITSLALVSWENGYTRPRIHEGFDMVVRGGRHPVIEKLNPQDKFVPNDVLLTEKQRLVLITGPNMGGKSTILRQTALIVLMAHLGMYVPAASAEIPLCDRIFTRVGASDNLVRGQSTFWLEMEETALILAQATERSLLVLDEIGRGTSTYDGVSIAWGIMEHLHNEIGAKTLFASHYHELIGLADTLIYAANYCVLVEENQEKGVVFLYKLAPGGVDKSYGIEVAKLAGLPRSVTDRAREILVELESEKLAGQQLSLGLEEGGDGGRGDVNSEIVVRLPEAPRVHQGIEDLRNLDLNSLTPLEAMNKLAELKKSL